MTSRFDHEALDDIEHRLRAEDAEFVELFRLGRDTAGNTPGQDWRGGFTAAIVLAVVVGVVFVVAGQPSAAVLCCLTAGVLAILRVRCAARRGYRDSPS